MYVLLLWLFEYFTGVAILSDALRLGPGMPFAYYFQIEIAIINIIYCDLIFLPDDNGLSYSRPIMILGRALSAPL